MLTPEPEGAESYSHFFAAYMLKAANVYENIILALIPETWGVAYSAGMHMTGLRAAPR